ncbi:glycosyltransferase [Nonomuraea sp. NPDC048901]|uniref:glycosyltransferase n=1 Tax=Nonomuraea sp. NPDC048901 TaxID=3155627 RepID=UPI0033C26D0B
MASILVVAHGHPDMNVGGGEKAAYDEFTELSRGARGHDCVFLFPRPVEHAAAAGGRWLLPYAGGRNELSFALATIGAGAYSVFDDRWELPAALRSELAALVERVRPSVVHFHHYYQVSIDLIVHLRALLPEATFVMTLHDYKAVCPTGYLLKSEALGLANHSRRCLGPTPDGCFTCTRADTARLRRRVHGYEQMFDSLDLVVTPNGFLGERFAAAFSRLPPVVHLDYGYATCATSADAPEATTGLERRFGFFGRAIPEKGLDSLLTAYALMTNRGLRLHISSPGITAQSVADSHPELCGPMAAGLLTLAGDDRPADTRRRIPSLGWIVVPSIWWENSPLVIQEAFALGRPVICAAGDALAEKVADGVNGLTYTVGDSEELAVRLAEATDRDTWNRMRAGVIAPQPIAAHCDELERIYGMAVPGLNRGDGTDPIPEEGDSKWC